MGKVAGLEPRDLVLGPALELQPGMRHQPLRASLSPPVEWRPPLPSGLHRAVARIHRKAPKHCRAQWPHGSLQPSQGPPAVLLTCRHTWDAVLGAPRLYLQWLELRQGKVPPWTRASKRDFGKEKPHLASVEDQQSEAQASPSLSLRPHHLCLRCSPSLWLLFPCPCNSDMHVTLAHPGPG